MAVGKPVPRSVTAVGPAGPALLLSPWQTGVGMTKNGKKLLVEPRAVTVTRY
ncbi:hypothetical protein ACK1X7_14190 [Streptomyces sp. CY1]|uniref:hypothetical protein n=1 Tax=Streptomyces sp. CY1 TaxID=3388313 RepID=UPI0039A34EDB